MALQVIGEIYDFALKGFFVVVIAIIILYLASEVVDDFKEKRKLKKDNKN